MGKIHDEELPSYIHLANNHKTDNIFPLAALDNIMAWEGYCPEDKIGLSSTGHIDPVSI
jgi:hypothetical protein